MAQTKTWTLAADGVPSAANKISETGDLWTLLQFLAVADTADILDETSNWHKSCVATGTIVSASGQYRATCNAAGDQGRMDSELATYPWSFPDNFDVQIDFDDLTDTTGNNNYKVYARLRLYASATKSVYVEYASDSGSANKHFTFYARNNGTITDTDTATITVTSSRLRVVRTGTNDFEGFYWDGSQWVSIATAADVFTDACYLQLTCAYTTTGGGSGGALAVDFDNLTKNSGTMVNGYWRDSPYVEFTVGDAAYADANWTRGSFASTEGGTGAVTYDDGVGNSTPPSYVGSWVTKANLQARGTGVGRYYIVKGRLTSDGSQTCTLDALSIPYSEQYSETGKAITVTITEVATDGMILVETGKAVTVTVTNREIDDFQPANDYLDYTLFVAWTRIDMPTGLINLEELFVSWRQPYTLTFSEKALHYSNSFGVNQSVHLFVNGVCVFTGRIDKLSHVGEPGNEVVRYHCIDLRVMSNEVIVCDPTFGVPHVYFNVPPTDEENYNSDRYWRNCGDIIKWLIDNHHDELVTAGIIIGDGYLPSDLTALTVVPPQILFSNMGFDEAIQLVMAYQPSYGFKISPATKQYRFTKLNTMSGTTLQFGPLDVATDEFAANLIRPNIRNRYTAVQISGGLEQINNAVALDSDGLTMWNRWTPTAAGLLKDWDTTLEATWTRAKAFEAGSSDSGTVGRCNMTQTFYDESKSWDTDQWIHGVLKITYVVGGITFIFRYKIIDSSANAVTIEGEFSWLIKGKSNLTYSLKVDYSPYRWVYARWKVADADEDYIAPYWLPDVTEGDPYILGDAEGEAPWVYWYLDLAPDSAGGEAWIKVGAKFEYTEGRFVTAPLYEGDGNTAGAATCAQNVALFYAYYSGTLNIRYPASGYEGTAYTIAGIERVLKVYDPMLRYSTDTEQFERLAQELLESYKDIIYEGTIPLVGLDWTLVSLGSLINVDGLTLAGADIVTGFESINAIPFSARYRFFEKITEVELSTDASQVGDSSYQEIRRKLLEHQDYFLNRDTRKQLRDYYSTRDYRDSSSPYSIDDGAFGRMYGTGPLYWDHATNAGLEVTPEPPAIDYTIDGPKWK